MTSNPRPPVRYRVQGYFKMPGIRRKGAEPKQGPPSPEHCAEFREVVHAREAATRMLRDPLIDRVTIYAGEHLVSDYAQY